MPTPFGWRARTARSPHTHSWLAVAPGGSAARQSGTAGSGSAGERHSCTPSATPSRSQGPTRAPPLIRTCPAAAAPDHTVLPSAASSNSSGRASSYRPGASVMLTGPGCTERSLRAACCAWCSVRSGAEAVPAAASSPVGETHTERTGAGSGGSAAVAREVVPPIVAGDAGVLRRDAAQGGRLEQ